MKLKDLMSTKLICIDIDRSLRDARRVMEKEGISRLLVTDEGKIVGILTERDVAERLGVYHERRISDAHIHVAAACTRRLIKIDRSKSIAEAAELMLRHGISSLVVTSQDKVIGLVTKTDLVKALRDSSEKVRRFMSSPLITVAPSTSLFKIRRLMLKHSIKRVPITLGGKLLGMITEKDIARALGLFRKLVEGKHWDERMKGIKAAEIMTRDVVTIDMNSTLGECVKLMLKRRISGLPVVEEGRLVGIITKTDLLKALT